MARIADADLVECSHSPPCGGCPLLASAYPAQLAHKRDVLARALERYDECRDVAPLAVRGAHRIVSYRPRAKLVVSSGARLGLFAAGTHDVVDIPHCRVLSPGLLDVGDALRALLRQPPPDAGSALVSADEPRGALRAVDLRDVSLVDSTHPAGHPERGCDVGDPRDVSLVDPPTRSVLVTLVLDRARSPHDGALRAAAAAVMASSARVASVAVSVRDADSPQILGAELRVVSGPETLLERASPEEPSSVARHGSFVQSHREQAVALRARVASIVDSTASRTVLELFAGCGTLALLMASRGVSVTMVESFAPAAADARAAASAQSLELDVRAADATRELGRILASGARFDAVVVDPPRRGLPPELRVAIATLAPAIVVYVSCHPPTLARDVSDLARRGYRVDLVEPFDMMPHTDEVETLVVLRTAPRAVPRVLYDADGLLVLDKRPHDAVASHDGPDGGLLSHVRARAGWADARCVLALDDATSGALVFARDGRRADRFVASQSTAPVIAEHIALVRGITRPKGTIRRLLSPSSGATPVTRYRRESVALGHSLLRVRAIDGGDEGSIRRHLAGIGHPVLGDSRHGDRASNRHLFERHGLDRPFLHRAVVQLPLESGTTVRVESALAPDLAATLATTPAPDARESSVAAKRRRG